jgi:NADH dehydrogenase (ubiquinone) Fe-S protein 6
VTGATKQVNDQWAIDLIAAVPVTKVKTRVVACDGGGLPSTGHPRIFINLDHGKAESCNYCGLRFELEH